MAATMPVPALHERGESGAQGWYLQSQELARHTPRSTSSGAQRESQLDAQQLHPPAGLCSQETPADLGPTLLGAPPPASLPK